MLEFCPMCKGLLQMKEEAGRNIGFCACGFKRTGGISISGEDSNFERKINLGEGVISEDEVLKEGFYKICKKCGFDKAEAFTLTSNESEVTIFKCLKCGNSTRQAQGSSKA